MILFADQFTWFQSRWLGLERMVEKNWRPDHCDCRPWVGEEIFWCNLPVPTLFFAHCFEVSQRSPTLEIITGNFPKISNFQKVQKRWHNFKFSPEISKTTEGPPQTFGRRGVARREQSEDSQAGTWGFPPRNTVGQRVVAAHKQNEDQLTRPRFRAGAPTAHVRGGGNWFFFVSD